MPVVENVNVMLIGHSHLARRHQIQNPGMHLLVLNIHYLVMLFDRHDAKLDAADDSVTYVNLKRLRNG